MDSNELKSHRRKKMAKKQQYRDQSKVIKKVDYSKKDVVPPNHSTQSNRQIYGDKSMVRKADDAGSVSQYEEIFPNRSLQSNLFRYEKCDEDACETDTSRDFAILSKASISQGYFQFKRDKMLFESTDDTERSTLFDLDLNLLNCSLSTIPFNERFGLADEYLNQDQLQLMKKTAENNANTFAQYIKTQDEQKCQAIGNEDIVRSNSFEKLTDGDAEHGAEERMAKISSVIQTSPEDAVSIKTSVAEKKLTATPRQEETDDLETWLDDILDD